MHRYLRSVGFSLYKKEKDIDELLNTFQESYSDAVSMTAGEFGEMRYEIRAEVARNMGVCIVGSNDRNGRFRREFYYPYFISEDVSAQLPITIYRHVDREVYSAVLDDNRIGVTLIFTLDNTAAFLDLKRVGAAEGKPLKEGICKLAAFSYDGKVLLPVKKDVNEPALNNNQNVRSRDSLIDAAKNGDPDAMEQLTISDMNTYAQITKRLQSEDVYSIVDTVFMPQGVECDVYSVIGEITDMTTTKNILTGEELYDLTICSNDMNFHVAINSVDLVGEPQKGRRFKGTIWMMGEVTFTGI